MEQEGQKRQLEKTLITDKYGIHFPKNITLEDVREAIQGRSEFRELIYEDFIVVDYLIQKNDSFPDPKLATDEQYVVSYIAK